MGEGPKIRELGCSESSVTSETIQEDDEDWEDYDSATNPNLESVDVDRESMFAMVVESKKVRRRH